MENPQVVKLIERSRKVFFGTALIGLLAAALPAAGAVAEAGETTATLVEQVQAGFILPKEVDGKFRYFTLSATRQTSQDTGEVTLSASAGIGECQNVQGFLCQAFSKPYRVARFEMDASLSTALVTLKRGKTVHRLTFSGFIPTAIAPPLGSYLNGCGGTTYNVYLLVRNANAQGKMFGRSVATSQEYEPEAIAERMSSVMDLEECL
jgi:hypothetical protein